MTDDAAEPRVPSVTRRGVGKGIAAGLSALGVSALSGTAAAQPPQSDDTLVLGDDKGWMYHDVQNGDLVIGHPDGELWRYDTSAGAIIPKQQIGTASNRANHYGDAADYNSVNADDATIGGGDAIGVQSASDTGSTSFNTWRQANADAPAYLIAVGLTETDGSTRGLAAIDVDESGGTSADYSAYFPLADPGLGSGGRARGTVSLLLPTGAQYRYRNIDDPVGNNTVNFSRVFVL